jgi:adenylate kinase
VPLDLIFMGPPGAGKGTQAARVAPQRGLAHIATGDMLREAVRDGTELGLVAKEIMARGDLVPDDVIIGMIRERLSAPDTEGGFILDGFPRTLAQAEALDAMLAKLGKKIDRVVRLKVDDDALLERVAKRFADQGRPDDNPESFKVRLDAYNRTTAPLLPYYADKGLLTEVDGMGSIAAVSEAIDAALA